MFSQTRVELSFSQSAADTWKQGERQTFELVSGFTYRENLKFKYLNLGLNFKFALGYLFEKGEKIEKEYFRPTDNELFAESVAKYPAGWVLDPYISASLRTQVTESFKLYKNELRRSAKLWDPVTSQQGLGFAYGLKNGRDKFSGRLGVSLKQTRAYFHTALTDDRKTKDIIERYKPESGIELKFETYLMIDSSTSYKGKAEFFGAVDNLEKWTIRWENELHIKIWKIFGILLEFDYFFDEKQSFNSQFKQSLRLGLVTTV